MAQLKTDPSTRVTMYRGTTFVYPSRTCDFCGQQKKTKKGRLFLYSYYYMEASIYVQLQLKPGKLFCCKACFEAYQ